MVTHFKTTSPSGQPLHWDLNFTLGSLLKVKKITGLNLLSLTGTDGENPILRLSSDLPAILEVLQVFIADQMQARKMSEEDFLDSLQDGEFKDAKEALFAGLIGFYTESGMPQVAEIITKTRESIDQLAAQIRDMDPKVLLQGKLV
ncbi:hypothetical protein SH668x_001028 [Planctomicrobium sp. SH668]|uniref:hypothetical protein n=1 Tax=Planctomicrobium sp. SH668 TaxID=3448126 RepID=UPI003F5BD447